jgi:hypothetical protein
MQDIATIIPTYIECNPEGFFLGQVICPKKDHTVRWQIGKIVGVRQFSLSIGPVLRIEDMIAGNYYEELPEHVDILVAQGLSLDNRALIHQLVVPVFPGDFDWQIGRIAGFLDNGRTSGASLDIILVVDIQTGKWQQVNLAKINSLIRRETDFAKFQK